MAIRVPLTARASGTCSVRRSNTMLGHPSRTQLMRMSRHRLAPTALLGALSLLSALESGAQQPSLQGAMPAVRRDPSNAPQLLQHPAISATTIAFVYAGDLWTVPRQGGEAKRLTAGGGTVTDLAFSPDGSQIAYTGDYDGNADVYVMSAAGG